MKKFIVITTIQAPTQALTSFAAVPGWELVSVGDRSTPENWSCPGVRFLPLSEQESSRFAVSRLLPRDHYCRKMTGYLLAMREGAGIIADTDDDNTPLPGWGFPPMEGDYATVPPGAGWVNVYRRWTNLHIWPRGFPLERLKEFASRPPDHPAQERSRIGVWQALADEDPDVDAVYRLTDNTPCVFGDAPPLVLGDGRLCPFNSQNTLFRRELFPLLYLPAFVTFRFTDILRGLVAQPVMWAAGFRLGFTRASVIQKRNPHDYLRDFESEIPCYLQGRRVPELVSSVVRAGMPVAENLREAYRALLAAGIVVPRELALLDLWLQDLATMPKYSEP